MYIEIVFDFVAALRIHTRYYVLEIIYSGVSMQTSSLPCLALHSIAAIERREAGTHFICWGTGSRVQWWCGTWLTRHPCIVALGAFHEANTPYHTAHAHQQHNHRYHSIVSQNCYDEVLCGWAARFPRPHNHEVRHLRCLVALCCVLTLCVLLPSNAVAHSLSRRRLFALMACRAASETSERSF